MIFTGLELLGTAGPSVSSSSALPVAGYILCLLALALFFLLCIAVYTVFPSLMGSWLLEGLGLLVVFPACYIFHLQLLSSPSDFVSQSEAFLAIYISTEIHWTIGHSCSVLHSLRELLGSVS